MNLKEAKDAQRSALKNLEDLGEYGKSDKENDVTGISIIKVGDGLGMGAVGTSDNLVEILMRGMGQSKVLRQAIQAAASGYEVIGFLFQDEPCDCSSCTAKREQSKNQTN